MPVVVIVDNHASQLYEIPVIVTDENISGLDDTPVVIIENRDIFYLYHCSVVVVLHVRVVIIARIKAKGHSGSIDIELCSAVAEVTEVELSVGIYGKFNVTFRKYIRISAIPAVIVGKLLRCLHVRTQEHGSK